MNKALNKSVKIAMSYHKAKNPAPPVDMNNNCFKVECAGKTIIKEESIQIKLFFRQSTQYIRTIIILIMIIQP